MTSENQDVTVKTCPACGTEFVNSDPRVKTCSHPCGARMMHVSRKVTTAGVRPEDVLNSDNPLFSVDPAGQWWYKTTTGKHRTRAYVKNCASCGKPFLVSIFHIKRQHQCSKSCGQKVSYAADPPRVADVVNIQRGNWKGGRRVTEQGYTRLYAPDHPSTLGKTQKGVLEHRLVMEKMLGRYMLPNENVHHRNGQKSDNRPENLELWVKSQPCGQRVEDIVAHAREMLNLYADGKHCPTCTCGVTH